MAVPLQSFRRMTAHEKTTGRAIEYMALWWFMSLVRAVWLSRTCTLYGVPCRYVKNVHLKKFHYTVTLFCNI